MIVNELFGKGIERTKAVKLLEAHKETIGNMVKEAVLKEALNWPKHTFAKSYHKKRSIMYSILKLINENVA